MACAPVPGLHRLKCCCMLQAAKGFAMTVRSAAPVCDAIAAGAWCAVSPGARDTKTRPFVVGRVGQVLRLPLALRRGDGLEYEHTGADGWP